MDDFELVNLWKSYDGKLTEALSVNRRNTLALTRLKIKSQLSEIKPMKWFAIVVGIIWCFFLSGILGLSLLHQPPHLPFIFYMAGLFLINTIGVGTYIYHLVLIRKVQHSEDVVSVQTDLNNLKLSTLSVTRILILQSPFYFALHFFWATNAGATFWIVNVFILSVAVAATLWLFMNIHEGNRDAPWFQFLFGDREWSSVTRSIELLEQIRSLEGAAVAE